MHVSIIGSGYVGTTIAACLADLGHEVVNVEIDERIVETINAGEAPIHESGLAERIAEHAGPDADHDGSDAEHAGPDADHDGSDAEHAGPDVDHDGPDTDHHGPDGSNASGNLRATTDYADVRETDVTFLCLPTPQAEDGSLDLAPMRAGSESLGRALAEKSNEDDHLVVVKSTVLPGTTEDVVGPILERESGIAIGEGLDLAMNPEFLRMGTAVQDFLEPDKVVVGATSDAAAATLRDLYAPILEREETDLVETDVREAELIKYANNAFLASKVSLVNELGNIAKEYGADAYEVLEAVGLDDRISARFMRSGLGWGGSCFPKDVAALRAGAREQGYDPDLLDAVVSVNDEQPTRLVSLLADHVSLDSARIAVLGLSFKPGTDDIRKSRALDVIDELQTRGATVVAYDPVAMDNVREQYGETRFDGALEFAASSADALADADGTVVATDWPEFDELSFDGMAQRVVVDGRRIEVDARDLEVYEGLTW